MTYHELFRYIKEKFINADVSGFSSDAAYQFNVRGEGEGAFYAEVKNNTLSIEPYEYYDRDVIFETDSKVLIDIVDGKLDLTKAYLSGKIKFQGSFEKAVEFSKILVQNQTEKTPEKKVTKVAAEKVSEKKPEKTSPAKKTTSSKTRKTVKSK